MILAVWIGWSADTHPAPVVLFACAGPKPPIDPVLRGIEKPLAAFAI
jgi:hypothetical protein